ncbi:hypothetical protein ACP4OV_005159 [Aristida adscensionis]
MAAEAGGEGPWGLGALPDELVSRVLRRLPPKLLLRCLAVCKAWPRLASEGEFLLAHHRLQPAQPLLRSDRNVVDEGVATFLMALHHHCLEAVDLRAAQPPRMVVRFKDAEHLLPDDDRGVFDALEVHGSCDGLLLLSYLDAFFVCNPTTRQSAPLPPLALRARDVLGFYAHAPSRGYRVLYLLRTGVDVVRTEYYVLTVGSQHLARRIGRPAASASVGDALSRGLERAGTTPPVLLHGSLHWPPQRLQENILAFDTAAEVFRSIRPPVGVIGGRSFLFEAEGKLALSRGDDTGWSADLWIMQDHRDDNSWAFARRTEVPVANRVGDGVPRDATIVSQEGDMLVEFNNRVLHYDSKGELLQNFEAGGPMICFTRHMLKESLVPHPFFRRQRDGRADGPPFFKGL